MFQMIFVLCAKNFRIVLVFRITFVVAAAAVESDVVLHTRLFFNPSYSWVIYVTCVRQCVTSSFMIDASTQSCRRVPV